MRRIQTFDIEAKAWNEMLIFKLETSVNIDLIRNKNRFVVCRENKFFKHIFILIKLIVTMQIENIYLNFHIYLRFFITLRNIRQN